MMTPPDSEWFWFRVMSTGTPGLSDDRKLTGGVALSEGVCVQARVRSPVVTVPLRSLLHLHFRHTRGTPTP